MDAEIVQMISEAIKVGGSTAAWIVAVMYLSSLLKTVALMVGLFCIVRVGIQGILKMVCLEREVGE